MALNDRLAGKPFDGAYIEEVEGVSHREYHTGFYYDNTGENANTVTMPGYICEKPFYCSVMSYDEVTQLAQCRQRNKMVKGSVAQLLTPGKTGKDIFIDKIFDADMNEIESAPHPKMVFYIKVPGAKAGDIIRGK
jgi:putative protease